MRQVFESPTSPLNGSLAAWTPLTYTRAIAPSYVAATCCHLPGVSVSFDTT